MPGVVTVDLLEDVTPVGTLTEEIEIEVLTSGGSEGVTISNIDPDPGEPPGDPGAFSTVYETAINTPIEFDVSSVDPLFIFVRYLGTETPVVAYDSRGDGPGFRPPFDTESEIDDLLHVTLFPRGGWPTTAITLSVRP